MKIQQQTWAQPIKFILECKWMCQKKKCQTIPTIFVYVPEILAGTKNGTIGQTGPPPPKMLHVWRQKKKSFRLWPVSQSNSIQSLFFYAFWCMRLRCDPLHVLFSRASEQTANIFASAKNELMFWIKKAFFLLLFLFLDKSHVLYLLCKLLSASDRLEVLMEKKKKKGRESGGGALVAHCKFAFSCWIKVTFPFKSN